MQVRICTLLLTLPLLVPVTAHAAEDRFDAIDRMLEESFEQIDLTLEERFEMLDRAMEDAYQRLSTEIRVEWGDAEVRLPTKKEWVDYSDDLSFRRTFDFEQGVVRLERLIRPGDDDATVIDEMQDAARSVRTDTMADLSVRDLAMRYATEALSEEGIELPPAPAADEQHAILEELDDLVPDEGELARLVEGALGSPGTGAGSAAEGATATVTSLSPDKRKIAVEIPFSPGYQQRLAGRYEQSVLREARRQNLKPSLLFAVMETESSFNPRATSAVPAYGLMQLVPRSGAMDAYNHVYGEMTLLGPEYLYVPEKNVELGSAYLNLLLGRYLRSIDDIESRRFCAIAAYNTGAGNVARAFTGRKNVTEAAGVINGLAPRQVYEHLRSNLPYDETRRYLEKVTQAQQKYLRYDQPFST